MSLRLELRRSDLDKIFAPASHGGFLQIDAIGGELVTSAVGPFSSAQFITGVPYEGPSLRFTVEEYREWRKVIDDLLRQGRKGPGPAFDLVINKKSIAADIGGDRVKLSSSAPGLVFVPEADPDAVRAEEPDTAHTRGVSAHMSALRLLDGAPRFFRGDGGWRVEAREPREERPYYVGWVTRSNMCDLPPVGAGQRREKACDPSAAADPAPSAVTVRLEGDRIVVEGPYSQGFKIGAQNQKGRWDGERWTFPKSKKKVVLGLVRQAYGVDVELQDAEPLPAPAPPAPSPAPPAPEPTQGRLPLPASRAAAQAALDEARYNIANRPGPPTPAGRYWFLKRWPNGREQIGRYYPDAPELGYLIRKPEGGTLRDGVYQAIYWVDDAIDSQGGLVVKRLLIERKIAPVWTSVRGRIPYDPPQLTKIDLDPWHGWPEPAQGAGLFFVERSTAKGSVLTRVADNAGPSLYRNARQTMARRGSSPSSLTYKNRPVTYLYWVPQVPGWTDTDAKNAVQTGVFDAVWSEFTGSEKGGTYLPAPGVWGKYPPPFSAASLGFWAWAPGQESAEKAQRVDATFAKVALAEGAQGSLYWVPKAISKTITSFRKTGHLKLRPLIDRGNRRAGGVK